METNIFYVYAYLDPRKPGSYVFGKYYFGYEPFYIGKGKNARMFDHLKESGKSPKIQKIQKILNSGLKPIIIKISDKLNEADAWDLENLIIFTIGRQNNQTGPLTNLIPGGSGGDTFFKKSKEEQLSQIERWRKTRYENKKWNHHTEETKIKLSLIRTGNCWGHHTEETKNAIRDKHLNKVVLDSTKEKLRIINRGKIRTEESKLKQSVSCKQALANPKIKEKLKINSTGRKNSNCVNYTFKMNDDFIVVEGYKDICKTFNDIFNTNYKDYAYLLNNIKKGVFINCKLISILKINKKGKK